SASSDPDLGDTLSYSWDLNADGVFGDSTVAKPTYTYTIGGTYAVKLKVTDSNGATSTSAPLTITAAAPGTAIFGASTVGAFTDTASTDYKEVSRYTAVAGSVTKLTGYVSGLGPNVGLQSVRAVLYADAGGSPGALLAVSNAVTVVSGQQWGWVDFVLPAPVVVSAGTIWMGYIASANNDLTQLRYDSVTADLRYNANAGGFAAGPTNPFGTAVQSSIHYSLYATVTTAPPPNNPPVAAASATPTSGTAPLTVSFDGSGSSDPDGDTLSYAWDLDGDGAFDDATGLTPSYTYESAGTYSAKLQVTDSHGAASTSSPLTITVSPAGTSGTFGTTTIGTSTDLASADYKEVSRYTAVAGTVTKLTGYISGLGPNTGSQLVRAVMYADSAGNPGALLGVSNAVTVAAGQPWGWVDFPFPSAIPVSAGTIWMGYIAGANNDLTQLRYDPATADLRYNANAGGFAGGPTSPFGTAVPASLHYSLYATVTTSSNTPPVPAIASPSSSLTWKVGDSISFSGGATDAQDGTEPAARLSWSVVLHHCPSTCHTHTVQTFAGVASGSLQAPDHDYPSYLELVLTATDAAGASASTSVNLQPQTVDLTFASSPTGASLTVGTGANVAPFTRTVIVGSSNSVSAPSQTIGGTAYTFTSWSDSGAQTHNLVAPATATTYTATFGTGPTNTPPVAAATATPTSGTAPLTVAFDGSGSSDADAGDTLTYSWDLNGDGTFGDSFAINPSYTFATAGSYAPKLKVTDSHGASTTAAAPTITVNPVSTGGTFGTTTVGQSIASAIFDVKTVSRYSAVAGRVTKLTGYVSGLGLKGGSQQVRAVLYADAGGGPGALLGVSSPVTINAGRAWGWVDFTLPSALPVTGGTIWMGYIASTRGGLTQLRYSSVNGDERDNKNAGGYAAGPSSPFGSSTTSNLHYSLYATYIP
ncbi:MAG: hypothetical protein QOE29_2256, partial [Gaiellaceae bacterium]|nr:hypothetical protein [Gaiellaceae bacterium]